MELGDHGKRVQLGAEWAAHHSDVGLYHNGDNLVPPPEGEVDHP